MTDSVICLSNEFIEVGISPECGGSLTYFRTKGEKLFDIMRCASQTAISKKDPLGMSMFVMLPYTNRIKGGEFTYWGITRKVAANHPMFDEPIHGDGWKTAWKVKEKTATSVTLTMEHDKAKDKGYPFSYASELTYFLNGKTLTVQIALTNKGIMPMPCGLGLHPYFNKTPNVTLNFKTKNVWYHGNDPIDTPYHTPEEWNFSTPKELKEAVFDTCFGGFENQAHITWPKFDMGVDIQTDEHFNHIVLYSPHKKNFFCLEPTTMTCNAFNLASNGVVGTGINSIGGNETIEAKVSFTVEGI